MPRKTKSARAKYMRYWRERRFEEGLCQNCNSHVYQFTTRCFKHLVAQAAAQQKYRMRKR